MGENYEQQILDWFEDFHANPEVSFREFRTTKRIAEILEQLGVTYRHFPDITGLIADIGEGEETAAVRADLDALWQEVDGVFRANHSCGHDAHISMVLGALLYIKNQPLPPNKRIRFIFQPAEEKGNGSLAMIERGALEKVTHLFGVHLRPVEELPFGKFSPSIHHGAGIFLKGKIFGTDAHGARPHEGKSAIDVIAALYQFIKTLSFSPFESYSVKLTKIAAGSENLNIIPGTAEFGLDIRARKNLILNRIKERMEEGLSGLKTLFGVEIQWEWTDYTPGAEVSKEAEDIAEQAIRRIAGPNAIAAPVVTTGCDDFHFYTIKKPEVKASMIGIGADIKPGLHHPHMHFNRSVLDTGARILADALLRCSYG